MCISQVLTGDFSFCGRCGSSGGLCGRKCPPILNGFGEVRARSANRLPPDRRSCAPLSARGNTPAPTSRNVRLLREAALRRLASGRQTASTSRPSSSRFVLPCRSSCRSRASATRRATVALGFADRRAARRQLRRRQARAIRSGCRCDRAAARTACADSARRFPACSGSGRSDRRASRTDTDSSLRPIGTLPGNPPACAAREMVMRPGLERFAQRFQHFAVEFREFVEKQHAEMRQRDLAGLRRIAPADQRHRARRMMRRAKRPLPPLRGRKAEHAGGQQWPPSDSASSSVMGGSRLGRRAASIDLPAPGGPTISR